LLRVNGEIEGIKNSILEKLNGFYTYQIPRDQLWTQELIEQLAEISSQVNKEIAVYADRKGRITDVSIGNHSTVELAEVEQKRNLQRLSGTRCIHTHPKSSGLLSSLDISSLKQLNLDAMIAIGIRNNRAEDLYVGILSPTDIEGVNIFGPLAADVDDFTLLFQNIEDTDNVLRKLPAEKAKTSERTILVGLQTRYSRDLYGISEAEVSFAELEELAKTAGALIVGHLMQKKETRDSSTIIGPGKLEELQQMIQTRQADLVIFDEELTGTQQRILEEKLGLKVLSRTGLILDIFAQHARSREGILQVELAQLEYRLPRLTGTGVALSRLGGGIGTRGPGETKLETDRRHIRSRIAHLRERLDDIRRQRGILRGNRQKNNIPVLSIVGYTNAGKSTLLNTLCGADVLAENKLFATLDPTTRKLRLNNSSTVLLSDTVGFIRRLPPNLLDAFKSTLEEVVLSDLILIVADAADPQVEDHIQIVDEILAELGAGSKPTLIVLNKIDRLHPDNWISLWRETRPVVEISALQGNGLEELKQAIEKELFSDHIRISLEIPVSDGAALAWLYANTKVLEVVYDEQVTHVEAELAASLLSTVERYRVSAP